MILSSCMKGFTQMFIAAANISAASGEKSGKKAIQLLQPWKQAEAVMMPILAHKKVAVPPHHLSIR